MLGAFPVVALELTDANHATVVIGDAAISDSGNDNFGMRRQAGRWKVVDL